MVRTVVIGTVLVTAYLDDSPTGIDAKVLAGESLSASGCPLGLGAWICHLDATAVVILAAARRQAAARRFKARTSRNNTGRTLGL
jgi:hypothetical protein